MLLQDNIYKPTCCSGNGHQRGRKHGTGISVGTGGALLAFSLPWSKKSEPEDDDAAVLAALKQGVLESRKGNMLKSQEAYHKALELAFDLKQSNKINEK